MLDPLCNVLPPGESHDTPIPPQKRPRVRRLESKSEPHVGATRGWGAAGQAFPALAAPVSVRPGLPTARAPFRLFFYAPPLVCEGWG